MSLLNLMLGFGFLGKLFSFIGNLLSVIGDIIKFFLFLIIWQPFMLILIILMALITFAELTFKALAGINPVYLNGIKYSGASGNGQDLVYAFITDGAVQNVFFSILALSFVLLLILTIVALIKAEFTLDLKGSAKGPIITRSLKSLANFLIVPAVSLISILGVNFITRSVYEIFGTGVGGSMAGKCLMLGLYNANNARNSRVFADKLSEGVDIESGQNPFQGKSQTEIAGLIDACFSGQREAEIQFSNGVLGGFSMFSGAGWDYSFNSDGYTNIAGLFSWVPTSKAKLGFESITALFFWYNIFKFDLVMPIGTALVMLYILLTTCLALVKRVFELTILFLLAPPMIAIAPLDGGNAEKRWRQEFMKRLLAVIAPVFAFNMYFLLVPLFENIKIFDLSALNITAISQVGAVGGTMTGFIGVVIAFYAIFDILFQVIAIIVGLEVVRDASALLSNLMGVDDLVKSGGELGKKYMEKGKNAVKAGVAIGSMVAGGGAFKGAAKLLKGRAGKIGGKIGNMMSSKGRAMNRLDKAKQQRDELGEDKVTALKKGETIEGLEESLKNNEYGDGLFGKGNGKFNQFLNPVKRMEAGKARRKEAEENFDKNKGIVKRYLSLKKPGTAEYERAKVLYEKKYGGDDDKKTEYLKKQQGRKAQGGIFGNLAHGMSAAGQGIKSGLGKAGGWIGDHTASGAFTKSLFGDLTKQVDFKRTKNAFLKPFQEGGDGGLRRALDATNSLFGETGNTFFKPLWNPNARHDLLFNSVPESKLQESIINQELWKKGNAAFEEKEAIKRNAAAAEAYDKQFITQMMAEKQGPRFYSRFSDLVKKQQDAHNAGDVNMSNLYAEQLKTMLDNNGITGKVNAFYKGYQEDLKNGGSGSYIKQVEDYKQKLRAQADENVKKERKGVSEESSSSTDSTKIEGEVKTKLTPDNISALAKKIGEEIAKAMKGEGSSKIDASMLQTLTNGFTSITDVMSQLQQALDKLSDSSDKK